jgi:hypothetical protein
VSSGDGMDTGPVLALEPMSTILPGNYQHLQQLRALDRPTLFLGDRSQEHTVPRSNLLLAGSRGRQCHMFSFFHWRSRWNIRNHL